jgi:hypothetical protein
MANWICLPVVAHLNFDEKHESCTNIYAPETNQMSGLVFPILN